MNASVSYRHGLKRSKRETETNLVKRLCVDL